MPARVRCSRKLSPCSSWKRTNVYWMPDRSGLSLWLWEAGQEGDGGGAR